MKAISFGQCTIIVGRGATEQAAWALACALARRRHAPHSVFHRLHGGWHKVTAWSDGRPAGHVYDAGAEYWDSKRTVDQRARQFSRTN